MSTQSELDMERQFVTHLEKMGYEGISIGSDEELKTNLKNQLEKHNKVTLSNTQFDRIVNEISKGSTFDKAKTLRRPVEVMREDGSVFHVHLINTKEWCKNEFQVTRQVTRRGDTPSRFDVTILINGLPLVQIELKRRGVAIKKAFEQIKEYKEKGVYRSESGLFDFLQVFVISNGSNTRYFAHNKELNSAFIFPWADRDNRAINNLHDFTNTFLEKCHLSKMICRHMVFHESTKQMMILRPYQYYAVEAIVEKIKTKVGNGYIWHTTGSGKTLSSFKASQIVSAMPDIDKVLFVVDRRDLDYQTSKEFNEFSHGCVDSTDNTEQLIQQLEDDGVKLVVTTIQKLNTAISHPKHQKRMEKLKEKRTIFFFDECHRSQFGRTHQKICDFFQNYQMFGFTGTPIFAANVSSNSFGKRTTKDLFDEPLHKYLITDAIHDENVLRFAIEYFNTVKNKKELPDGESESSKAVLKSPERMEAVIDYIIENHDKKTHSREFTGMFCVSDVESLLMYYKILDDRKSKGLHDLKVATIFSCSGGEEKESSAGQIEGDLPDFNSNKVDETRVEQLNSCINDYNQMFGSSYNAHDNTSFYDYYKDISKRVRKGEVDILLVVNMFLTGFDSKTLNTLYVDKNLKHHGLIQAYSRTNRVYSSQKTQGNICCFRNLKKQTDEALAIFANKHSKESVNDTVILKPYEELREEYIEKIAELRAVAPTVDSVDDLMGEEQQAEFIEKFRDVKRAATVMESYSEYKGDMEEGVFNISEQSLKDYQSKYLDLYESVRARDESHKEDEKPSILDSIDFEIGLFRSDKVTVDYILGLISIYHDETTEGKKHQKKEDLLNMVSSNPLLREKHDLFDEFIALTDQDDFYGVDDKEEVIKELFSRFVDGKVSFAKQTLCVKEGLDQSLFEEMFQVYLASNKLPLDDDIIKAMKNPPGIVERKERTNRIKRRIERLASTYYDNMG